MLSLIAALQAAASVASCAEQNSADRADNGRWEIIAAGRVEPRSGEIKIAAPLFARIADVPARAGDKVLAGDLLVRLEDDEARARLASAQAQMALRKRARNDVAAAGRAGQRRKAEDAVADAQTAVRKRVPRWTRRPRSAKRPARSRLHVPRWLARKLG